MPELRYKIFQIPINRQSHEAMLFKRMQKNTKFKNKERAMQKPRRENTMTINRLASTIAKIEGKKSQTHIGNIREMLAILSDIMVDEPLSGVELYSKFIENGLRRKKKRIKKV